MTFLRQTACWLACCAAGHGLVFSVSGETSAPLPPEKLFSVPTNLMPPPPMSRSPVNVFRQLLAMSAREREVFLTNKPPAIRAGLLAKVHEYQSLGPDERELRLRATELSWWLLPFFHEPATNHAARLALVPEDLRELVQARVVEWEILPPQLQREFLANERALRYFTHVNAAPPPPPQPSDSVPHSGSGDADQVHWNALSMVEREKMTAQFNHFFELTPREKQKTLNTLSPAERVQMEKTLQSFDRLPASQRARCIRAFNKFAGLAPQDRAEFLKSAERWAQMSPKDRQVWRDLVSHVPLWPPLPQSFAMPPMPPQLAPLIYPVVATNHN